MKTRIVTLCLFTSLACLSGAASAKGCLKGAAVGGVAGHVAGSHGVLGAAAGCAVGRHRANKKDAAQAQARTQTAPASAPVRQAPGGAGLIYCTSAPCGPGAPGPPPLCRTRLRPASLAAYSALSASVSNWSMPVTWSSMLATPTLTV